MGYNVKKIRHVCSVKGCSNRETFLIAKNGQLGGVYLCKECAKKAFEVFESANKACSETTATTETTASNATNEEATGLITETTADVEVKADVEANGRTHRSAPTRNKRKAVAVSKDGE